MTLASLERISRRGAHVPAARAPSWPALRRFLRSRPGRLGAGLLTVLVIIAVFQSLVAPYDPLAQTANAAFGPPSWHHWLGTDELGRDILSRLVYGTRDVLIVSILSACLSGAVGIPLGLLSGYFGGRLDALLMRLVDVLLAVPAMLLALVIITILGPGTGNLLLAIAVPSVPAFARLTRSQTKATRNRDYVVAAQSMGAGNADIMARTILPNLMGVIAVQFVVTASHAVITEAGLSFLGLGRPPPAPIWGAMLQTAQSFLYQAPWYGIAPGLAITLAVIALDGVGRGLQAAFGVTSPGPKRSRLGAIA